MQAIDVYMACLQNPNTIDYYAEVFEGMSCLVWEAMNARRNMEICDPVARSKIGWHGSLLMSSGT
jgi:hypothetical protein